MTGLSRSARMHELPLSLWPAADAAAWRLACNPSVGPFGVARRLSPFTYEKYRKGWGVYLWHLDTCGRLDRAAIPADRARPDWLWAFYAELVRAGNSDNTLVGRFQEIQGALRLMAPDGDFAFITRLDGIPIRKTLEMKRRVRFIPDSRHAALWAERLFCEALDLTAPAHRRGQVRDAAFLGIGATRGPRLRSLLGMQLGRHLIRSAEGWTLFFDRALMKGGRKTLELPLSSAVGAMLDRYVSVERQELLGGQTHDYLWVNHKGRPLSRSWATGMVRHRSGKAFGTPFSPHRFRDALTTTQAVIDGSDPLGPSLILGHSHEISLKHYNHATALEASRRHDACLTEAEDVAARMLRRPPGGWDEADVPSLHSLKRWQRRRPCPWRKTENTLHKGQPIPCPELKPRNDQPLSRSRLRERRFNAVGGGMRREITPDDRSQMSPGGDDEVRRRPGSAA
jgi:site-specific recombinase XerD